MFKKIRLVFSNGTQVVVAYSSKVFVELSENLGKDHKVEAANFTVNTKNIDGIFFELVEEPVEVKTSSNDKKKK